MLVESFLDLAGEILSRAEWVSIFLGVVGLYWLWLGFGGVRLGHTRGFGWRPDEQLSVAARPAGWIWSAVGSVLLLAALTVWIWKA